MCHRQAGPLSGLKRTYGDAADKSGFSHVWTAPCWQGFFDDNAELVGAAMCPAGGVRAKWLERRRHVS